MPTKKHRPWLTSGGVELSTTELKEVSKSWDETTWSRYLNWFESSRREALLAAGVYEKKCHAQTQTAFVSLNQDTCSKKRRLCEHLLSQLPEVEANVLRLIFFTGHTQRAIAAQLRCTQPMIHYLKKKAIRRLQEGLQGDIFITRRLMREDNSQTQESESSALNAPLSEPLREEKVYAANQYQKEFENIQHPALKVALGELSERQRQILYLRFWCDHSIPQVARELQMGINMVDEACTAALSRIKRRIIQIEFGYEPEGGPACA